MVTAKGEGTYTSFAGKHINQENVHMCTTFDTVETTTSDTSPYEMSLFSIRTGVYTEIKAHAKYIQVSYDYK